AAGVERVRTAIFSDKNRQATRIVFDLTKDAVYRLIDDSGGNVRLVFGPDAHAPLNQVAGPPAAAVEPPVAPEPARAQQTAPAATAPAPAPAALPAAPAGAAVLANSPVLVAAENSISQQVAPRVTVVPPTA